MRLKILCIVPIIVVICLALGLNDIWAAASVRKPIAKLNVELSSNLGKRQKAKYRIIISSNPAALGEAQAAKRIAKAASILGWEWAIVERLDLQPHYLTSIKPNFVLSLREEIKPIPGAPHFLYLHVPMFMYLNKDGTLCTKAYPNVLLYDGFLHVVPDAQPVKEAYARTYKRPYYALDTVLSVPATRFIETPKTRLCYWGSTWDKARGGGHYQKFYALLDQTNYFDLYGPKWSWQKMNLRSYRGMLPMDAHAVVDRISTCGIALVLHSHEHLRGSVPTSRVFEAAAASAVIICDQHPFVKKQFGDSVLYIDPTQSPEDIYYQIDQHVKWIHAHPIQAMALAKKSHSIFLKRFTLENELRKIAALYELMKKEKQ